MRMRDLGGRVLWAESTCICRLQVDGQIVGTNYINTYVLKYFHVYVLPNLWTYTLLEWKYI